MAGESFDVDDVFDFNVSNGSSYFDEQVDLECSTGCSPKRYVGGHTDLASSFGSASSYAGAYSDTSKISSNYGPCILLGLSDTTKSDLVLADKLDTIACRLRGGIPNPSKPKTPAPRMPLKDILCAVETRLKEKLTENSMLSSRGSESVCNMTPKSAKGSRCGCKSATPTSKSPIRPTRPVAPTTPTRSLPRPYGAISPDPARIAQSYFDDEDQIVDGTGEDLKGTVADILKRRKLARQLGASGRSSPRKVRTPVRQLQTFPVQEEGHVPEDDFELLGVTDVSSSDYGDSVRSRKQTFSPMRGPVGRVLSPPPSPKLRFIPDPLDDVDWKSVRNKTVGDILEEKRREQAGCSTALPDNVPEVDDLISEWSRRLQQNKQPPATSTPACRKSPRRLSAEYLATMGRGCGAKTPPCRSPCDRSGVEDSFEFVAPPPGYFELDEIGDFDVSF